MSATPGPWTVIKAKYGPNQKDYAILAGGIIAEVFYRIDDDVYADVEANACLIARAPELLDENEKLKQQIAALIKELQKICDMANQQHKDYPSFSYAIRTRVDKALARVEDN